MKDKTITKEIVTEENGFARWSRRKRETAHKAAIIKNAKDEEKSVLTDADMPPVESLQADSDISSFMSTGVSDALKRKAFRKIFLSGRFNIRDGLDDYDEDFTSFQPLGEVITAEYRRWKARYDAIGAEEEVVESSTSDKEVLIENDDNPDVTTDKNDTP